MIARTSILFRLRLGRVRAVLLEHARRREFTEPMAHHVFRNKHWIEDLSVVHRERETYEFRRDRRTPRPGLDRRFLIGGLRLLDLLLKVTINERTFFNRTTHNLFLI